MLCRVLKVNRSGFYAWRKAAESKRAIENKRLITQIKSAYVESGGVYGSPRITAQLNKLGIKVSENRVARLMKVAKLKANIGYKRRYFKPSAPSIVVDNRVQQQFLVMQPDHTWVTDITYIKTYEGCHATSTT